MAGGREENQERHDASPASPAETAAAAYIDRLRGYRGRRGRDPGIARQIAHIRHDTDRAQRKLGAIIDLWETMVPQHVLPHTTLTAYRTGTLTVTVDSSSTAYELDRLLREGLLASLRQQFRGTLTRVRVRVGTPGSTEDPGRPKL